MSDCLHHIRRLVLGLFLVGLSWAANATIFTVTNTNDTGPGSLRQAILDANAAGPGTHSVQFVVYGQIVLNSSLPQIINDSVTIDGGNNISLTTTGSNLNIDFFSIAGDGVTVRNFALSNTGGSCFILAANTVGVTLENLSYTSNTGSYLNTIVYVGGASSNLTLRNITSNTGIEACYDVWVGRAFYFTNGLQTNLTMDNITVRSANNNTGCEGIVFRDASINGLSITNTDLRGFRNGIALDHTAGAVETGKNILLNHVTVDSFYTGVGLGFYSDFVDSNVVIRNSMINQNVPGTTDDGDYSIRFDNATTAVTLDSITLKGTDIYTVWFNGAASNIQITNSSIDCADGEPGTQLVRFEGAVTDLLMRNVTLDANRPATTDDGEYGIVFIGATTNTTLDSLTINESDVDGIYVAGASTNFQLTNSTIKNNFDGIEFYNNVARNNVDIVNSSFTGNTRAGIVVNGANAVTDVDITGDTLTNNASHGIWFHGGAGVTDAQITGCIIRNNGGAGINNDAPTKVIITNNSIYNNTGLAIANPAGNCAYNAATNRTPVLVSSTLLGGGQYDLQITIPNITAGASYDVDIYANDPAVTVSSGQYYVTTLTGLSAGSSTHTITYNNGPGATGAGFWTATLRIPANNCGTSEFGNKLAISAQGPGNVDASVKLWLRADAGLTNNGMAPITDGQVVNRWNDFSQGGAPNGITGVGTNTWKKGGINFNPTAFFNGSAFQAATPGAATPWINSAAYSTFAVFNQYATSADASRVFVMYDQASGGNDFTTNAESLIFARNGANVQTHRGNAWENPAIPNALGRPGLFASMTNATSHALHYNGMNLGSAAYSKGNIHAEQWFVGAGYASAAWCCGSIVDVAEIITYDRELTAIEIAQVQSYLALKYGISKAGNYVASDGTTIYWDSTGNTVYNRHITGIGRDDSTFLYQKQSLSVDTGIVTLALGSSVVADNASNTSLIGADKSFFLFGDNGAATAYATAVTGTNVNQRMARTWKVQKTAWTDQNVTLKIKNGGSNNYLLLSTDPTFATISQELALDGTGNVTINSSLLANGIYFTVGAHIQGPSLVTTGIALWLRADDGGASGTQWSDYSGLGNSVTQPAAVSQAVVLPASFNFNPALKFDGVNDYLSTSSLFTATGINNAHIYGVAATDAGAGNALFAEMTSNTNNLQAHIPFTDGNMYWDAPFGYRIAVPWGGAVTIPYLWTFTRSATSGMTAYRNKGSMGTLAGPLNNIAGNNSPFNVGAQNAGASAFNGRIGELIVYNNSASITNTQRLQIESYLALKYGLTLSPASPVDYLSSDSTVKMWTAASNVGFGRHITGIGRDSINTLNQKQSISADTGFVIISLGVDTSATNAANPNTITNDKSFLVFGDNGAALNFTRTVAGLTDVNVSLARTWKLQKTAWADQDITFVTNNSMAMPQYLLISTDTTFGTGDIALPMTTGKITLNSSQLPDGAYFTFGNKLKAPGAVTAGIRTWYRADDVTANSSNWFDFSGNDVISSQTVAASQPALMPAGLNYNTAYTFNGTQFFRFNGARMPVGISARTVMLVTANATGGAVFSYGSPDPASFGGRYNLSIGNGGRNLEISNSQYGNGGGNTIRPNITSLVHAQNTFNSASQLTVNGSGVLPWAFQLVGNQVLNTLSYPNGYLGGTVYNNAGPSFIGRIGEVVVYDKVLTASEKNRVESYLALKYGITLDQTTPADYTASDSVTKMWTASANTGYNKRITGIGRDDSDSLNQKQSLSVDTGIVAIALGDSVATENAENAATVTNNLSFLVFGDNGQAANYLTSLTGLTGVNARMNRIFKVDKTNWADQNITFKLNGGNDQTQLLVSADPVFGTGDALYPMNADSTVTINSSNLADGSYFTFARTVKGPNCVDNGIVSWLRADDGLSSGIKWNDFSGFGTNAIQNTVAAQAATNAAGMNFNYALQFDGSNDNMSLLYNINPENINPLTVLTVYSPSAVSANSRALWGNDNGTYDRFMKLDYVSANNADAAYAGGNISGGSFINTGIMNDGVANGSYVYINNKQVLNYTQANSTGGDATTAIGGWGVTGGNFSGKIAEVVVYNRSLNAADLQKINSYLSLKYGITMNGGIQDYLASDSTVYWIADTTYKRRITGIGKDDCTQLNTRQSLSVDTGFVTLALGNSIALTNVQNTASVTNDKSFLVFADNGLPATDYTNPVGGVNATQRISRVWKVNKANWGDQNITLKAQVSGSDNYLLVSTDPTFGTLNQELPVDANGTITLNSSLLPSGTYFSFGRPIVAPGCVAAPVVWLKADNGVTANGSGQVSAWADASGNNHNGTQATAANQPTIVNGLLNYNPALDFDGVNDNLLMSATGLAAGTAARTAFAVARPEKTAFSSVFSYGGATGTGNVTFTLAQSNGSAVTSRHTGLAGDAVVPGYVINGPAVIQRGSYNGTQLQAQVNGGAVANNTFAINTQLTQGYVGTDNFSPAGSVWDGKVGEVIFYNRLLSNTELQQVNTYLAIKYGITAAHDYLATGATDTLWHVTGADSSYKNNIAGIWRQDCSALNQKQSRSINDTNEVVIAANAIASSNTTNAGSMDNGNFLIWGANGTAAYTFNSTVDGIASTRLNRVWKVRDNGNAGQVQLAIPKSALVAAGALDQCDAYKLLVSNTDTDPGTSWTSSNATEYTLSEQAINGTVYYATNVTFPADAAHYFTFGRLQDKGAIPYLVADNTSSSVSEECEDSDWIYFLDPVDSTHRILAIQKNGNTIDQNDFTLTIDATTDYSDPTNSPLGKAEPTGEQKAIFLMRRLVDVGFNPQAGHSITTPVTVRMYWDDGSLMMNEKQIALDNLNTLIAANGITVVTGPVFKWFKAGGQDITTMLANLIPDGIAMTTGGQSWDEAADVDHVYGTDGILPYVDFKNVTSFSTFGGSWIVNQPDNSPLPVRFESFEAIKDGNAANLNWKVSNEKNVSGYTVQRSADARTWSEIGFVAFSSANKGRYSLRDDAPLTGFNYYRIRQDDVDGKNTYSATRRLNFDHDKFAVALHPNPADEMINLNIDNDKDEEVSILIMDVTGRLVLKTNKSLSSGMNKIKLPTSGFSNGTYLLEVVGSYHSWKGKFVKVSR